MGKWYVVAAFVAVSLSVGCSNSGKRPVRKQIQPGNLVRTPVQAIGLEPQFLAELERSKGYVAAGNCVQWVTLSRDGAGLGEFLELSSVGCAGGNRPAESDVKVRLKVKASGTDTTQRRLWTEDESGEVGILRHDGTGFKVEGLCDVNPLWFADLDLAGTCELTLGNGRFTDTSVTLY